jgi:hypothetical protein
MVAREGVFLKQIALWHRPEDDAPGWSRSNSSWGQYVYSTRELYPTSLEF